MKQFALEAAPEALHAGVVVSVPRAAHAGDDPGGAEPLAIRLAGILDASVALMHQAGSAAGQPRRSSRSA
jgi:hypothetical protein